jgi:hypothetical protein
MLSHCQSGVNQEALVNSQWQKSNDERPAESGAETTKPEAHIPLVCLPPYLLQDGGVICRQPLRDRPLAFLVFDDLAPLVGDWHFFHVRVLLDDCR